MLTNQHDTYINIYIDIYVAACPHTSVSDRLVVFACKFNFMCWTVVEGLIDGLSCIRYSALSLRKYNFRHSWPADAS